LPVSSVKTVVVMVPLSGFADTVTPPIFSPPAELMVPESSASAASAVVETRADVDRRAMARLAPAMWRASLGMA
jgi:hypothetical protein